MAIAKLKFLLLAVDRKYRVEIGSVVAALPKEKKHFRSRRDDRKCTKDREGSWKGDQKRIVLLNLILFHKKNEIVDKTNGPKMNSLGGNYPAKDLLRSFREHRPLHFKWNQKRLVKKRLFCFNTFFVRLPPQTLVSFFCTYFKKDFQKIWGSDFTLFFPSISTQPKKKKKPCCIPFLCEGEK